jgi:serine/threonine protein phosphatase 1
MSIFAISDIHGCYTQLFNLLKKIPLKDGDTLIFLGDYIDRGPQSKDVITLVFDLLRSRQNTIALKGNHEDMAMDALNGGNYTWLANGGNNTIANYKKEETLLHKHIELLNKLPLYHIINNFLFSHTGGHVNKTLKEQTPDDFLWERNCITSPKKSKMEDDGYKLIFGHTPMKKVFVTNSGRICIDTGACFGNKLSCVQLPEFNIYEE